MSVVTLVSYGKGFCQIIDLGIYNQDGYRKKGNEKIATTALRQF